MIIIIFTLMCAELKAQDDSLAIYNSPFSCHKIIINDKEIIKKAYKWLVDKKVYPIGPALVGAVTDNFKIAFTGTAYTVKEFTIYSRNPHKDIQGALTVIEEYDFLEMLGLDRLAQYFTRPEWAKYTDGAVVEAACPVSGIRVEEIPEGLENNQFFTNYVSNTSASPLSPHPSQFIEILKKTTLVFRPYNSHYEINIWWNIGIADRVYKFLVDKKIHKIDSSLLGATTPEAIIEFPGDSHEYEHKIFKVYKSDSGKHIEGTLTGAEMYDLYYLLRFNDMSRRLTRPELAKVGTPENLEWLAYWEARAQAEAEARARGERLLLGWKPPPNKPTKRRRRGQS